VTAARCLAFTLLLLSASSPRAGATVAARASGTPSRPILDGNWSDDERVRIEAALAKLPVAIVARAANRVVRDRQACEPDGLPRDEDLLDVSGAVHLCTAVPEGRGLDIGRQVALALVFAFDRHAGWSDDPAWRRLNGWQRSVTHPLRPQPENLNAAGFVAPRGRQSPRWDLVSFTVALLLGDDVGCRLLSQASFLRGRLEQLAPGVGPAVPAPSRCAAFERWADLDRLVDIEIVLATPSTAMVASLFGHVFLRIVYRDDNGETPLHTSQTIAFLADNDVPFAADRTYALKGLVGSYNASLHERAFLDAYREYVVLEGRDLRRWRLNLTPAERRAVMERLWTVEHTAHYAYYFFRRNCATLMLELVEQALAHEAPIRPPGLLAAPPASLLEPWARSRGADGAPLLQFVATPLWSFDHRARLTSCHRRELEARIAATLGVGTDARLLAAFQATHLPSPETRARAYDRLAAPLADGAVGAEADVRAWLSDSAIIESHLATLANLEAEARAEQERHRQLSVAVGDLTSLLHVDAARLRADGNPGDAVASALDRALGAVNSDDGDERLRGYRALQELVQSLEGRPGTASMVDRVRLLALLRSEARYDVARMKGVPGLRDALLFTDAAQPIDLQPYVAGREDLVRVPVETRVSGPLRALQRTKQSLFVARALGASEVSRPVDEGQRDLGTTIVRAEREEYEGSLSRSGIDQMALSLGTVIDRSAPATIAPALVMAGALYDERLGDRRRFGFPSDTAMVVGRSAVLITAAEGAPTFHAYDARLFGYRSLRRALPEASAVRGRLGWELTLDLSGNPARNLTAQAKLGWGALVPVLERRELSDHLLAGAGLAYAAYFPGAAGAPVGRQHGLSAPIFLEARLGLGAMPRHRSWLAARLSAEPLWVGGGVPERMLVDVGASLEAHLALRGRAESGTHDPALLLSAQVTRSTLSFDRLPERFVATVSAGVELR